MWVAITKIDRSNKKVYARIALPNAKGKKLSSKQLIDLLSVASKQENGNTIISNEFKGYMHLESRKFIHLRIDHSKAFSDHNEVHTKNIESFWVKLKRGIYGIYHQVSLKYMQRYVDEFCFRYNNRKLDMFNMVFRQSIAV